MKAAAPQPSPPLPKAAAAPLTPVYLETPPVEELDEEKTKHLDAGMTESLAERVLRPARPKASVNTGYADLVGAARNQGGSSSQDAGAARNQGGTSSPEVGASSGAAKESGSASAPGHHQSFTRVVRSSVHAEPTQSLQFKLATELARDEEDEEERESAVQRKWDPSLAGGAPIPPDDEEEPLQRKETSVGARGVAATPGEIHAIARAGVENASEPLPHLDRIQPLLAPHDLSGVRTVTGGAAAEANAKLGALGYTMGERIAFRSAPDVKLAAHEAAHVVQQRGGVKLQGDVGQRGDRYEHEADVLAEMADATTGALGNRSQVAGDERVSADHGAPPKPLQIRPPSNDSKSAIQYKEGDDAPATGPEPPRSSDLPASGTTGESETRSRDNDALRLLEAMPGFDGTPIVGSSGGLVPTEQQLPEAFQVIRERMIRKYGQRTFDGLYRNDTRVMALIRNSTVLVGRLRELQDRYWASKQQAAYDTISAYVTEYELDYPQAAKLYGSHGEAFLAVYELLLSHSDDVTVDDLRREAERAQGEYDRQEAQRAEWAEIGRRAVGRTIATREILFWWDDAVTLKDLLEPGYGHETQSEAITWATISGRACAVLREEGRYYVYTLNHDYSLQDVLAKGFERRTNVVSESRSATILVTNDGRLLTTDSGRYLAGNETGRGLEGLEGASSVLANAGESLDSDQLFRLFRQMTRDLVFVNLEQSRKELQKELDRFFQVPGIPMRAMLQPAAGQELQRDTAALRRHLMQAISLADSMSDTPNAEELSALEEVLAAIGRIHEANPTAALMLRRNRDEDATGPAKESDVEDRVAGKMIGDAAWSGAEEIGRRLSNIDRVQKHLLQNPDAVLDLTPLHPQILQQFTTTQRADIELKLTFHNLAQLATALGMALADLAVLVTGAIVGGPIGFALTAASSAFGVGQTIEAFQQVSVLESMTELGFTADSALATPQMVSSARMWAWIGVGLSIVDLAGLAGSARSMARMRAVLTDPELGRVLAYSRGNLREAADAMGITEQALARELRSARGAERTQLLERIRAAMEPKVSGGRYGTVGWDPDYSTEVLARMRQALLDDAGDVPRVTEALRQSGVEMDAATVAQIKRYIFDSPGIAFTRQNYDAWMRLASGRGQIGDVRFMVHESSEISGLTHARFNFLGEGWESMGRHQRTGWHRKFDTAYLAAHRVAIEAEFDYVAKQVSNMTGGRTTFTRETIAAVDDSLSGRQARELMMVEGVPLENHTRFYNWRNRAGELIELDETVRTLRRDKLRDAFSRTTNEFRAADIVDKGMSPSLRELIAAVKAMRL